MDPLSIVSNIAGLISLAQTLIPLLARFVDDVRSYPKAFSELVSEVTSLYGVLCGLQPIIERLESASGFQNSAERDMLGVSLAQLEDLGITLRAFVDLLTKHRPPNAKNAGNCIKLLLLSLTKGKQGNLLAKMERHKSTLAVALLGVSVLLESHEREERRRDQYGEITLHDFSNTGSEE